MKKRINRKGIILAGGSGTRMYPLTSVVCKQLLPVYDKPMIYYPLSVLMLAGIREILIISTPKDLNKFKDLLGDGKKFGCKFEYIVQEKPRGLAEAMIISKDFVDKHPSCLILGDNIFYGSNLRDKLNLANKTKGCTLFVYRVKQPEQYGIIKLGKKNNILDIIEKPKKFVSNFAVTGMYFYDEKAFEYSKNLKPSKRGELEITDLNKIYLKKKQISFQELTRGSIWFDTGTLGDIMRCQQLIRSIELKEGLKISCPEEVALRMGYLTKKKLLKFVNNYPANDYRSYIESIINEIN